LRTGIATQADLARRFAVSQSTISRLVEKAEAAPALVRRARIGEIVREVAALPGSILAGHRRLSTISTSSRAKRRNPGERRAPNDSWIAASPKPV
jgi:predicted ATPase